MERLITESLDSLWFYNNVFITSVSDSESLPKLVETEDVFKTIVEDKNNEQESEPGNSFPVKPLYAEVIAMSIDEGEVVEVLEYYYPSPREKEQKRGRRRRRSKRGLQRNRRRILGELDLGFHGKAEEVSGSDWVFLEENFGYKINQFNLNYNMAMKEHLKTWPYVVACTVR